MKHIAFYISSHGYGHLTRCLAVIGHLLEKNEYRISIKCAPEHVDFSKGYFAEIGRSEECTERLVFDAMRTDIGTLLVPGTLDIDIEGSLQQAQDFANDWESRLTREMLWYEEHGGLPDVIYADIVPWALLFAKRHGIRSVLVSNFTWLDTCRHFFTKELYAVYEKAFQCADLAICYELSMPSMTETFRTAETASFAMRCVNEDEVREIRKMWLDGQNTASEVVYVSVGGLVHMNEEIDVEGLPYLFVTSGAIRLRGSNVRLLPKDAHTQNYMAAADYCITKPGWSTTSEALLCKKPIAFIERPDSYEDCFTLGLLRERNQCVGITQEELFSMERVMEKLQELKKKHLDRFDRPELPNYTNDAKRIADRICEL